MKKTNHFLHGGETTPQYFCFVCRHAHTKYSKIGKEHLKYMVGK